MKGVDVSFSEFWIIFVVVEGKKKKKKLHLRASGFTLELEDLI